MVYLNVTISLPIRAVCVECKQDLKIASQGPAPGVVLLKCPGCGLAVQLIQAETPAIRLPQPLGQKFKRPPPRA